MLLDWPGMGDGTLSALLSKMLVCLPAGEDSEHILFKVLFLWQLPADIQDHLAHSTALTIRMLAEQADAYFTLSGSRLNQPSSLVVNVDVAAINYTCQKRSTENDTRLCFYHSQYGTNARRCTQNNCPMAHVLTSKDTTSGKRQHQSPVAVVAGAITSRLLHIQDRALGCSFLIDTGAEVSLVLASPADHHAAVSSTHSAPLVAANGTEIYNTLHGLSHPGVQATHKLVARKYIWHGLGRQVGEWVKSCIPCQ